MNELITDYKNTVTLLEELVEFHPNYLDELSLTDKDTLSKYYFAGRKVDVNDLEQYRNDLIASDSAIQGKAQDALGRFKAIAKI